jgi:15-cis-phytoene synthase
MTQAPFASEADYELCRRIHRRFGTTYYFSTLRFPKETRRRVHALYGFVRVPDEWVDNPVSKSEEDQMECLRRWRHEFESGMGGVRPEHPVLRAFCDVARECSVPPAEARLFLDAMEMDLHRKRYPVYSDLQTYMRGSASAVGIMMCHTMDAPLDGDTLERAKALGEAMQLTNFLRDVGEDADRGRIYLPLEDLDRFGAIEGQILEKRMTAEMRDLVEFQIRRARDLYRYSDAGIARLPGTMQRAVLLARVLYSRILDRIEERGCDPFSGRARTTKIEKIHRAVEVAVAPRVVLTRLESTN